MITTVLLITCIMLGGAMMIHWVNCPRAHPWPPWRVYPDPSSIEKERT